LTPSLGYTGNTEYYILPTEHLPLLQPLRAIPVIGNPLANLIEPNMKVIVNLGYGDPNYGYSTSPPDIPTPFGLFPDVAPTTVFNAFAAGTQQGISNFSADMQALASQPMTIPSPQPLDLLGALATAPTNLTAAVTALPTPAEVVNVAASIISTDYALLLPAADIATAMVTSVPLYDVQLFVEQLAMGNLVNAIGLPVAADVGLASVAGAVFSLTAIEALVSNIRDLQSLIA
jgi:hypothetical protein